MSNIISLTVNSIARTAINPSGPCVDIAIMEDPSVANYPTTDLLISKTLSGPQKRIPAGQPYTFQKKHGTYQLLETAGYVETVTGSTTVTQDEGGDA